MKTIVITGVSSGLGRVMAEEALSRGHKVVGTLRQKDQQAAFEAISPGRSLGRILDVTDLSQVSSFARTVEDEVGPIDVLVNNAGFGLTGVIEELDLDALRRQFDVNVFGPVALTRLDRFEPELNDVGPGEVRDTTSPDAAAASLRSLLLDDRLEDISRRQLTSWLVANKVGGPLLRASLPSGWKIADRTGSGNYGSRGVIAVIWPVQAAPATSGPVVIAVYLTGTQLSLDERSSVVAEVGAALVEDLKR